MTVEGRRAAGGREERRHQRRRAEREDPCAAAQRPQRGRTGDDCRRGRSDDHVNAAGASRERGHIGRRRAVASASAYVLDGAMHNNPQDNLNMPFPFPDALQEFSVATSGLERAERHRTRAPRSMR